MNESHQQLAPGDTVAVNGCTGSGKVISVSSKYAIVAFQSLEVRIALTLLNKIRPAAPSAVIAHHVSKKTLNIDVDAFEAFNTEIDLHGMSVKEALDCVDQWLDRGFLLGHRQLKIIHGKGTGALRSAVRTYLKSHDLVHKVFTKHAYPGGDGVTWLALK